MASCSAPQQKTNSFDLLYPSNRLLLSPLCWPKFQKILFFTVLAVFWLQGFLFSWHHGNRIHIETDGTTEGIMFFSANHYLDHGLWEHHLLPTYPPFGEDLDGQSRTEPFVYNHYLPFSDFTLVAWLKIFGRDAFWSARLIPHTLTVLAMGATTLSMAALTGSTILGCIFLSLLMVPRSLTAWSTCLYGHPHATALFMLFVALALSCLAKARDRKNPRANVLLSPQRSFLWRAFLLSYLTAFLVGGYVLDWGPLLFLAVMALTVWFAPQTSPRLSFTMLLGIALGGLSLAIYQLTLSSLEFGSLHAAISHFQLTARNRIGIDNPRAVTIPSLWNVLREFNKQSYGATGFTAVNLMALTMTFVGMGWLSKILSRRDFFRGLLATILAYLAAASWPILMKSHSLSNLHFTVRHYFELYFFFLIVALPVAFCITVEAAKNETNRSSR